MCQIIHTITFDQNIGEQTSIDLLCISHFDEDHVTGLKTLLKSRAVKNILVPLLTVYDIFLLLAKCEKSAFTSVSEVLYDVYHPNGNRYARVIEVSPSNPEDNERNNDDEPRNEDISLDEEFSNTPTQRTLLKNKGHLLVSKKLNGLDWEFKPFYMSSGLPPDFKDILKTELRNIPGVSSQNEEDLKKELLIELLNNKIKHTQIKKAYQKAIDQNKGPDKLKDVDINRYSLCLYSGAKNQVNSSRGIMPAPECVFCHPRCYYSLCWQNCYCRQSFKTRCLYLGDYNAKKIELLKHYSAYNDKVDVLQIPHHGAVKNWNIDLPIFFNPHIAFTQAGLKKYLWPSKLLCNKRLFPICLNFCNHGTS